MYKYLPSKKFTLILLSIILVLGIIYVISFLKKSKNNSPIPTPRELQTTKEEFLALDTDGDGLKDWEETLWGTDPKLADTDGDGTNDNDEINANRDPLLANINPAGQTPSDKISEEEILAEKKAEEEFNNLSATDKFSRLLFSEYIAAKNGSSDGTLDNTTKEIILRDVLDQISGTTVNKYTLADIKTSPDMAPAKLKAYGNELGNILIKYSTGMTGNELLYILQALEEENPEVLNKLTPIINNYSEMTNGFLTVTVPKDLLNTHLKIVNNLYNIKVSLEYMQNFFVDAVNGTKGLQIYQNSFSSLLTNAETLRKELLQKGIIFTEDDVGYVFINISQQINEKSL